MNSRAARLGEHPDRTFRDDEGRSWTVTEATAPLDDRRGASLIFATTDVLRRVRDYPADWFERSDADLIAISCHR